MAQSRQIEMSASAPGAPPPTMQGAVWRDRTLSAVVVAETISALGTQISGVAIPWFVLTSRGSPRDMGFTFAVELLPLAVFGVPSGAVVERIGARRTLFACNAARIPLVAAVPLLYKVGLLSFPVLLVLVAAIGVFATPCFASQRLLLPHLLGDSEARVAQGASGLEAATRLAMLLGPAAAGALIAAIGPTATLWLDAASFAPPLVVFALLVPSDTRARPPRDTATHGLFGGLRAIAANRTVATLAVAILLLAPAARILFVALPVVAYNHNHDARLAGWLLASWGGGALLGTALAYAAVAHIPRARLILVSLVATASGYWLLAFLEPLPLIFVLVCLLGLASPLFSSSVIGAVTAELAAGVRPKAVTALLAVEGVAATAAFAAAGWLIARADLATGFAFAAALATAALVISLTRGS
jgi:Na+/melibiose symporter-like transporter